MKKARLEGSMVALVTPFKNGRVDEKALKSLIEFQIRSGTDAIVPCGTTGESATLTHEEHLRVIELTIETVRGRIPVIAGTGSNSTREAVKLTKYAEKAGADAALLITPYYNKPSQEGLYRHFKAVARAVSIPIIPYNVPSRTGVNMLPDTVARVAEIDNIIAIKEATGQIQTTSEILANCPKGFKVLSGEDAINFPIWCAGGRGSIGVTANVAPGLVAKMWDKFDAGDISGARKLHYRLLKLNNTMFIETNPIPVKAALALMGKVRLEYRLPLCPPSKENMKTLKKVLKEYKLIK